MVVQNQKGDSVWLFPLGFILFWIWFPIIFFLPIHQGCIVRSLSECWFIYEVKLEEAQEALSGKADTDSYNKEVPVGRDGFPQPWDLRKEEEAASVVSQAIWLFGEMVSLLLNQAISESQAPFTLVWLLSAWLTG